MINISAHCPCCQLRLATNVWAFQSSRFSNTFFLPHLPHTYYYWTGLDLGKVHVQFNTSCLESSVCFGKKTLVNKCSNCSCPHSGWTLSVLKMLCGDGLSLEFLKMELYIHFYSPFLHMHVAVRGWNSTYGITLFTAKHAVLRMGEHSSTLLCPHLQASLEDSNMTCQMRLMSAIDPFHKLSISTKTWTAQNWAVVSQGSSPVVFCWSIDN